MAYGLTVDLLKDVLPVDAGLNPNTVRNHAHRVAEHADAELGDERLTLIDGCPRDWEALPLPEGEIVVGIDNGYVRDWIDKKTHFGVLVGKSSPRDRPDRYFGLVSSVDAKPKRRLEEILHAQSLQMNQAVTFLADGGDDVRNLAADMVPYAAHYLDWFHITMRLTVLGQFAKGLAHTEPEAGEQAARILQRIKWYLWHGNTRAGLFWIDCLTDDIAGLEAECTYPKLRAFRTKAEEFMIYIQRNAYAILKWTPKFGQVRKVESAQQ